jgi:hypothetical protein
MVVVGMGMPVSFCVDAALKSSSWRDGKKSLHYIKKNVCRSIVFKSARSAAEGSL